MTGLPRTALIVGAGIGGLAAGIALRKAGWNIRVFERAGWATDVHWPTPKQIEACRV